MLRSAFGRRRNGSDGLASGCLSPCREREGAKPSEAAWSVAEFRARWIAAGFQPKDFWEETPNSLINALEGAGRAADQRREDAIVQAWHIVNLGRPKDIPQLDKYLAKLKPPTPQSADEVAGIFLCLKAKGKSVKIKERKRA